MYGSKGIEKTNYRSLVIAGIGTIGKSLVTLGADQFSLFNQVFAIDKDGDTLLQLQNSGISCRAGDINEPQFLHSVMSGIPGPSLFVNLCSGTDNIRIRKNLAQYDTAYLDSCASTTRDSEECRFSRLMPYTYSEIETRYPHWLCWGINPGLVEIITRRILAALPDWRQSYDVNIYEFDRLQNGSDADKAAVGWCPEALVEEIMLSPTLEIITGIPSEDSGSGSRDSTVNWDDQYIPAKIVGHEDIWNLTEIPAVRNARFYYSLNPQVMHILNMNDAKKARRRLYIPRTGDEITGLEQVAVQVSSENMNVLKTLVWTEDHSTVWKAYGLNAVQYQTAKSLLLAIMLLQRTDYGLLPFSHNASNLPIAPDDWTIIDHFMQELKINWHDGTHLNLHVVAQEDKGQKIKLHGSRPSF